MRIVIPARRNSKGLPFKNRKLFGHTIDKIPRELLENTTVTTDDEVLIQNLEKENIKFIKRSEHLSRDTTCTKEVMIDTVEKSGFSQSDVVVMLYLTYPQRTWGHVENAYNFFVEHGAKSLLCRKELKVSPYLCMIEDGLKGKQVIEHDLYRRQDYLNCFELSHYVCVFRVSELNKLNKNMYNEDTIFYNIGETVDVDTPADLRKFYDKDYS